jgi:pyridoxamine--pyruvate transaminase
LNAVELLGPICRARGVVSIVDVVSSYGGIELRSDEWQLDLLVAGPQKCLGGPPGMSLMAVSPQAWAAIEANPDAPRGSFLSMLDYRDLWHGQGRFPFTPSVPDVHGVLAATELLLAEGLDAVQARHERVARACWAGVEAMGLRLWPRSVAISAASVTSIRVPDGLKDTQVRDHARERYGVQLSAGQGAGNIIRIGHMGNTARPMWMVAGLTAVGQTMIDLGAEVNLGAGVEAAMASLAAPARVPVPA